MDPAYWYWLLQAVRLVARLLEWLTGGAIRNGADRDEGRTAQVVNVVARAQLAHAMPFHRFALPLQHAIMHNMHIVLQHCCNTVESKSPTKPSIHPNSLPDFVKLSSLRYCTALFMWFLNIV